jgi:hypothetical protein
MGFLFLYGLIIGTPWVNGGSFCDIIIIDSSLGRGARLSYIIVGHQWTWPPARSLEWIEHICCTHVSFHSNEYYVLEGCP